MHELIPIYKNENGIQAVSARELHSFLESRRRFADWIKDRIEKYGFISGQDYEMLYYDYAGNRLNISHHNFMKSENQHIAKIEYALTLDAAKELSMVEGNEKGRQARRYFIEVDKKFRAGVAAQLPQTFADALRLAADQQEQLERQKALIQEQAPKVLFADAVETSRHSCLVGELAKILKQNGVDIGQNRLFKWLRNNGYLCQNGELYNQPTQRSMNQGLFEVKKTVINKPDAPCL